MSWAVLNTEDVLSEFTLQEAAALRTLQGSGSGSGLPFTNIDIIVARTIDDVRGYIIAGGYQVDPTFDNTLPLGLFQTAIAIARWRVLISTPLLKQLQTDDRKKAYEDALKKLTLIAEGKFAIEAIPGDTISRAGNWNSENKLIMRTHPIPRPSLQFPPMPGEWANDVPVQQPNIGGAIYLSSIVALRDDPNSLEAYPFATYATGTLFFVVVSLSESTWILRNWRC